MTKRRYAILGKNCVVFPIYMDRNPGLCVGMAIKGVGQWWKEHNPGSGSICGYGPLSGDCVCFSLTGQQGLV